ncbi:MAG: hypothetical protein KME17_02960 [Cyanosarcina radialis HA8281-LM2]|jgi:hypothetical protein|nr:hypothetical protein [Cyanosarcina radialis HA8281-LM2]
MTDICWQKVNGIIQLGHQVASGLASNSPYPHGTIEMQMPIFQKLGLDLTGCFPGTLNVSIHLYTFEVVKPECTFKDVEWTDKHPPETFSFSRCRITFADSTSTITFQSEANPKSTPPFPPLVREGIQNPKSIDGWIYYPHPETKKLHFQSRSILEIIAAPIPNIEYGSRIEVEYNPLEIVVKGVQNSPELLNS